MVLRGPMVTGGARGPANRSAACSPRVRATAVHFDPAKLGLPPGEYEVSAGVPSLPRPAARGVARNLETEPVRVTVP